MKVMALNAYKGKMWALNVYANENSGWYNPHHEIEILVGQEWLQDSLEIDLYETTTHCLYGSKNLGIMKTPQSIMEELIDKLKENITEIFLINSKSFKRTKENFLSQNYEWNLYHFSIS